MRRPSVVATATVTIALVSTISAALGLHARSVRSAPVDVRPTGAVYRGAFGPTYTRKQVDFYAAGARRDPKGAIMRAMLAAAYLQRCRETGDIADAQRAAQAAQSSLKIRRKHNDAAVAILSQSLLMQHRFNEALGALGGAGGAGASFNVAAPQTLSLMAEIHVERGDYDAAAADLAKSGKVPDTITGEAIHARLLEMNGYPEEALALLRSAQADADENSDVRPENLAWFHMRVGDLLAELGRADDAAAAYRSALALDPRHILTLTALTRLCAGRSDWKGVLAFGAKAAEIVPNPEVLALMGDAYNALGDTKRSRAQYSLIEAIGDLGKAQGTIYDRQRALYLADHGTHLDEALKLAQRELRQRHDVYAYDTLAWCCYKKGLLSEAADAAAKALARGTKDARLYYHSGVIALARGDKQLARLELQRAMALNACFLPFAPDRARRLLKGLM